MDGPDDVGLSDQLGQCAAFGQVDLAAALLAQLRRDEGQAQAGIERLFVRQIQALFGREEAFGPDMQASGARQRGDALRMPLRAG